MRRIVFFAGLLLLIGAVLHYWPAARQVAEPSTANTAARSSTPEVGSERAGVVPRPPGTTNDSPSTTSAGIGSNAAPSSSAYNVADFPIAAPLNAPTSTIARDLQIVADIFDAWRSNFPHDGNPVGENADITAALMGKNRLELALIPAGHRALNERGELCDRWGTPFRFHQLSGTQMEIRSAGPDRKFATGDDSVWTP